MGYKFGSRSIERLQGVHPDLVRVMNRAIEETDIDFTVLEGVRSIETQIEYVRKGASKTMNSRHLTGHAVDIAPLIGGKVTWSWPPYHRLARVVKAAAKAEKVPIKWGGDWIRFKDGPHWELPRSKYK